MEGFAKSFRELRVYQAALLLASEVHEFCKGLPPEERFAMANQMRRASRSVCQNTAEAWRKRRYRAAFVAKLSDAETEAGEMQSCLDLCKLAGYVNADQFTQWDEGYEAIIAQLITMSNQAERWCQ